MMRSLLKSFFLVQFALSLSLQSGMAADSTNAMAAPATPPAPVAPQIAPGTPATPPSDPTKFELYLLVGQSNMAGRAPVQPEDKIADPRVLVLDHTDNWVTEGEPIHFDKPKAAGVGPGYTFAKLLADKEPGVTIGLIPCAFGGTALALWDPKSKDTKLYPPYSLYQNAIRRAQIAMKSGTLKGILWHQGETDCGKDAGTYAARLAPVAASFRADLHAPYIPFIAGEIGYFNYVIPANIKDPKLLASYQVKSDAAKIINAQIDTLPTLIPNCAVVSARDLVDKGDHLHFNNASQKELGKRYLDAFLSLLNSSAPAKP